jgi:hypothetical protein
LGDYRVDGNERQGHVEFSPKTGTAKGKNLKGIYQRDSKSLMIAINHTEDAFPLSFTEKNIIVLQLRKNY